MLQSCVTFHEIDESLLSVDEEVIVILEESKSMMFEGMLTSSGQDLPLTENESVMFKHPEIDQTTSGIDTA